MTIFTGSANTWTEAAQLTGSTGSVDDQFGSSIDLDGNRLMVGAPTGFDFGDRAGAVYVFENDGTDWNEVHKITTQRPTNRGLFGDAVVLDGDLLVVGAPIENAGTLGLAGTVYVHDATTGAHPQTVEPTDRNAFQIFGNSRIFHGGTLVIGAPGDVGLSGTSTSCTGSLLHRLDQHLQPGIGLRLQRQWERIRLRDRAVC